MFGYGSSHGTAWVRGQFSDPFEIIQQINEKVGQRVPWIVRNSLKAKELLWLTISCSERVKTMSNLSFISTLPLLSLLHAINAIIINHNSSMFWKSLLGPYICKYVNMIIKRVWPTLEVPWIIICGWNPWFCIIAAKIIA